MFGARGPGRDGAMVNQSNPIIWEDFCLNDERPDDLSQLALVTLTLENKQRLFQNAINASEKLMESTRALKARLEHFDPSTAQHFGFKDLTLSKIPFRLLRCPKQTKATNWLKATKWLQGIIASPETEIDRSNLTRRSISPFERPFDSFICLSYCWHSQDWTPITGGWIPPKGRRLHEEWPITTMMLRAFLDQRRSYDEGVWIDALCIDQNNPTEKMYAVGNMDVVYKSARIVVIILEDICLADAVAAVVGTVLLAKKPDHDCIPIVWHALTQILSSRWFKRAWCWHELELSADSTFLVPTESNVVRLDLRCIEYLCIFINSELHSLHLVLDELPLLLLLERLMQASIYKRGGFIKYRRSPMAQFNDIIDLNCSFEADKVGVAVNAAGLQLYYRGPQMSNNQCRWILAMLALFAGDLSILCGTGPAIQLTDQVNSPSWLRWCHDLENNIFALYGPVFPKRASIVSIDHERIILDLLVLENYTLHIPCTKTLLITTTFLDRHAKTIGLSSWVVEDHQKNWFRSSHRPLAELLGCSLECSLPWLMESMAFSHVIADDMDFAVSKYDIWPLISDLLIQAYPDQESTISSLTDEQKRSIAQHIRFLWFHSRLELGLLNSASGPLWSKNQPGFSQCQRLDWGTAGGQALTRIKSNEARDCCLAVPVALSDPCWTNMNRLWLLKPLVSTTGSHWKIIGKIKLVTPRPLEEEGGLVLRAAQTIRG
jgi:Heterokaryon incompatibility protein (HET)